MGTVTLTNTLTNGTVADADDVMDNLNDIVNEVNGSLDEDNIASTTALSVASLAVSGASTLTGAQTLTGATTCSASLSVGTTLAVTGITTLTGWLYSNGLTTVKQSRQTVTANTDAATITFNLSLGNIHTVTLGGNRILATLHATAGQCFMLELKQDGTGSRTVTWFSGISWAGGSAPTLTTTAAKTDCFGFRCTAADTYLGYIIGQNI